MQRPLALSGLRNKFLSVWTWDTWLAQVCIFHTLEVIMFSAENITGALAVIVVLGIFVLLALSQAIPTELWTGFGLILGFFFGNVGGAARAQLKAR